MTSSLLRGGALVILACLALGSYAWCQTQQGGAASPDGAYHWPMDSGEGLDAAPASAASPVYLSVLDVLGKLVIAVLLAWGIVHALRWWRDDRGRLSRAASSGRQLRLEESLALGTDERLYLVEVAGRRLLLAGGEGGLHSIAQLDEVEAAPSVYRSVRRRADGSSDELNIAHTRLSTRPVRPDVVADDESWEQRRTRLLEELQQR